MAAAVAAPPAARAPRARHPARTAAPTRACAGCVARGVKDPFRADDAQLRAGDARAPRALAVHPSGGEVACASPTWAEAAPPSVFFASAESAKATATAKPTRATMKAGCAATSAATSKSASATMPTSTTAPSTSERQPSVAAEAPLEDGLLS